MLFYKYYWKKETEMKVVRKIIRYLEIEYEDFFDGFGGDMLLLIPIVIVAAYSWGQGWRPF